MTTNNVEKMPPHDPTAERSVLGSCLRLNAVVAEVLGVVQVEDFYAAAHQAVFRAIVTLWYEGKSADLVTVADLLKRQDKVADLGPEPYGVLAALWDAAPTAAHAAQYARIVRDLAITRHLLHAAVEIQRDSQDGKQPAGELLEAAEKRIFAIAELGTEGQSRELAVVLPQVCDNLDRRQAGGHGGIATGFIDLDKLLCGLKDGELTILAARTSIGKTSLALGTAYHAAAEGFPVLFVSLEQSAPELAERLLSLTTEVDSHHMKKGRLAESDVRKLSDGVAALNTVPIHIDDKAQQTMLRITANARRLKMKYGIRLVVVDYVQLVEPEDRRANRQEQVAGISRRLKGLARELQIPVVALAQLNRGPEEKGGRRPRLSDLRESDALAHDADVVLLLWQDGDRQELNHLCRWEIIVEVAKHRNGPTGSATLLFYRPCMKFENLAVDFA